MFAHLHTTLSSLRSARPDGSHHLLADRADEVLLCDRADGWATCEGATVSSAEPAPDLTVAV